MQAIVLVGGLGTRLREVVSDKPKPMAPVGERPFLYYLLKRLSRLELSGVVLAVGYLGEVIRDYFGDGSALGLPLQYSLEHQQLGTAGAIRNAAPLLTDDTLLVLNGDTYYDLDYHSFTRYHQERRSRLTIALRQVADPARYGSIETDAAGRIEKFVEKGKESLSASINAGIYLMERRILENIPEGRKYSLETELIPDLLRQGMPLYGFQGEGYFIDIGIPADYFRFCRDVQTGVID